MSRWRRRLIFLLACAAGLIVTTLWLLTRQPVTGPQRVQWEGAQPALSRFWITGDGYWTLTNQNFLTYVNLQRGRAHPLIDLKSVLPERLQSLTVQDRYVRVVFRGRDGNSLWAGVASPLGLTIALQPLRLPAGQFTHLLGVGGKADAPEFLCLQKNTEPPLPLHDPDEVQPVPPVRVWIVRLSREGQSVREYLFPPETRPLAGYREKDGTWTVLAVMAEEQIFLVRNQRMDRPAGVLPAGSGSLDLRAFGVLPQEATTLALTPEGKLTRTAGLAAGPLQWRQNGWRPPLPVHATVHETPKFLEVEGRRIARRPEGTAVLVPLGEKSLVVWPGSDAFLHLGKHWERLDPLPWGEHLLHTRALDGRYQERGRARENVYALFWIFAGLPLLFLTVRRKPALAVLLYLATAVPCFLFLLPLLRAA